MHKFMILFQKPRNPNNFEKAYNDFLALVEQMPDIRRRQVINILGSPLGDTTLFRILEVYFDDQAAMDAALRSSAGQMAGAGLGRFRDGSFELVFAEVFEEEGGQTPAEPESEAEAVPEASVAAEENVEETAAETEDDSPADDPDAETAADDTADDSTSNKAQAEE